MSETPKQPKTLWTRIRRLVVALLVLSVVAVVGDYAWFRTQVPLRFAQANWAGKWSTQQYGLSGRILVHMPDPMPENEDFKADALVYYPIYSVWKTGQFVKMEFAGRYSPETSTSGGVTENEIAGSRGSRGKLKFKAVAGNQVVDYVAIFDESGTRIVGGYVSQQPADIGHFFLQNY